MELGKRLKQLCVAVMLVATGGIAGAYQNPARGISNIGDPSVLRHEGVYYLFATTGVFQTGNSAGIACWSSTDLMNWQARGWAFLVNSSSWAQYHLNAPQVIVRNGKFHMFFSARNALNGRMAICVAESSSGNPAGPYVESVAPFVQEEDGNAFDPHVFEDDNGRTYLYYGHVRGNRYIGISAYELNSQLGLRTGKPLRDVLARPFSQWEVNPYGFPIVEAPHVVKRNGLYYLIYSGDSFLTSDYAAGYATAPEPWGPFTRFAQNPVLRSDLSSSPGISGPGSGCVVASPDGSELFYLYNAHTDPSKAGDDRSIYIDRLVFSSTGELQIAGPTRTCQPDPSAGGAGSVPPTTCPGYSGDIVDEFATETGWVKFHSQTEGFAWCSFDSANSAIVAHVTRDPSLFRRTAVMQEQSLWLPYSQVGPDNYVRAKFSVYRANQENMSDLNQVPNFKIRAATRFAHGAIQEYYHHMIADPAANPYMHEYTPSADPERPSVYTVDFDPIDVPTLRNTPGEGIMRAFEAYALEPQENGDLVLTESSIGVYPKALLPTSDAPDVLVKVYEPSATDAGTLKAVTAGVDARASVYAQPAFEGYPPDQLELDETSVPLHFEAGYNSSDPPPGVTMDTGNVPGNRIGIAVREFFPGADRTAPDYIRIEPGRQYTIRWHMTSTVPTNRQAIIRLRARTVRWGWNNTIYMGGAYAAGATNNAIAQELLPGVGSLNPDKRTPGENGGWYTMIFHTPLDPAIRPEFPSDSPLSQRMPKLMAEPGPGVDAPSFLDLKLGADVIDTLDFASGSQLEHGNVTIDRIEIRSHPRVPD